MAYQDRATQLARLLQARWQPRSWSVYEWWVIWRASNYQTLPFAGGLVDQPAWLIDEFWMLNAVEEFYSLQEEMAQLGRRVGRRRP